MTHTVKQIWFPGRKQSPTCCNVTEYDNGSILAATEAEKSTEKQMLKVIKAEYPEKDFEMSEEWGYRYAISEV